ncbi:uncharacterized protein LOC116843491 [Odontomachus brunneus]|uniref:uncharacterized protein LOC116843491 n=1 Tax=Odontomachus brunneus TaxID=486640 RepID=UPI0013F1B925|nr:uncharacterized protein LOC116843491 [Odontomachus brunneus]
MKRISFVTSRMAYRICSNNTPIEFPLNGSLYNGVNNTFVTREFPAASQQTTYCFGNSRTCTKRWIQTGARLTSDGKTPGGVQSKKKRSKNMVFVSSYHEAERHMRSNWEP